MWTHKNSTHLGIVTVEGELLKPRCCLSLFKNACETSFRIAYEAGLWASRETRLITQTETWFVILDSISQRDYPTYCTDMALNGLELFLKLKSPLWGHLLSELSFYNTSQIMCFSGSWLYRELSLNFSARFSKLSTIYTPHPAFQFHHPKTHMFSLLTGDGYHLLSLYHVHNTVLRALHNTPFYLYMIL